MSLTFLLCIADYLIVGSDSGRIVILDFDVKTNLFKQVHCETFGRTGSRRIVPGQYLAADPKGRAVMIASVEKSKLVYILNRDSQANLTISSPLEAHRSQAIIHAITAVDVGFENPLFAALEVDYEDADRDPTGEAFENTQKVRSFGVLTTSLAEADADLLHLAADLLRVGSRLEPRRAKVVDAGGPAREHTGAGAGRIQSSVGEMGGAKRCARLQRRLHHLQAPGQRRPSDTDPAATQPPGGAGAAEADDHRREHLPQDEGEVWTSATCLSFKVLRAR